MSIRESKLTIARRLINSIKDVNSTLSINRPGDPLKITTVDPIARESSHLRVLLDYLHKMQTIQGMKYIIQSPSYIEQLRNAMGINPSTERIYTYKEMKDYVKNDITAMARNYGVTRIEDKYATVTVRFYYEDGTSRTINVGTKVYDTGNSSLYFSTTTQVTGQTPTYDGSETGWYYIDVSAQCNTSGATGNVAAYRLTKCTGAPGHVSCTNRSAATGGFGKESMISLINRVESRMKGYYIPTRAGYENFMLDNGCRQAKIIMPGDTESIRPGGVDIYVVLFEESAETQEIESVGQGNIYLNKQPVKEVTGITVTPAGGGPPVSKTEGVDFEFVKDSIPVVTETPAGTVTITNTSHKKAGTVFALDKVQWKAGSAPASGDTVDVSYTRNSKIEWLQDKLNEGSNYDTVGEVYVKEADRVLIDIGISDLTLKSGYALETVKENIQNALNEVFYGSDTYPGTLLGDDVYESDIIGAIEGAEGVDTLATPLEVFRKQENESTELRTTTQSDLKGVTDYKIYISNLEYASLGNITYY